MFHKHTLFSKFLISNKNKMKYQMYIAFVVLCLTIGCNSDDESSNPLEENELLSLWEIKAEGLNNVMSLEDLCCDFIEFLDDDNSNDLRGNYNTYVHNNITGTGTFSINLENNVITYSTENVNTY